MAELIARFSVTGWEPQVLPGIEGDGSSTGDGDWVGAIVMRKTYTSGLIGESVAEFLSSGSEEAGRGYLAAERITGTLDDGRTGSFTVHHGALQHPGDPSAFGYIVPGTGTADFAGFTGSARIVHDADGAFFVFTLGA
ncbi:DUF3224 domain-containing protein [Subtercola boreus]|uniref:DUF3224 domain-containing protein n=1 Tax=Subtercola boreus TaxID=120213 RepID=A0A3E0W7P7_9MICO|nr:DUF3224 domain-containing protein [Subtercola boreus]RFA18979.1 hypothetical protein B7R23_13325 [Subtercola boreus]RFA19106.1 hypothetical protein B7R24_13335 [Subtercola boreus]RFA25705.1 hypothetical protein B7R25_13435 [Subtercola boreus]